jgi:glyoxylase-like metal-dependent hydrolase (beta-lactamase superfamily II)
MPQLEIVPGLLRWTAAHPDWNPQAAPGSAGDWGPDVGSVLYETPDTVVLIDPLLPSRDRVGFLGWLDERIADRPVSILTTIRWHRRDREELAERYQAATSRAWNAVPPGVKPRPLRGAGETMFWLPAAATLVPGDRLLGAPAGGLRVCPQSWLGEVHVNRAGLIELLRSLLELPIERVLVSHGEPVLCGGSAALVRALAEAEAEAEAGE